ncbi:hypothetical protein M427DRAFT_157122 [Gonapodya prolifera JEL478]|uniref:SH3 domain-containing protein n=1 Tax=Gonapodya prolifera (strain JEL478) TaxID=1344416 RepID=A0A139A8G1_GONPJ|nr:hypothetical protein M427DRAFT_157122 [Gonapodya prolifera JEL478]|eukprot:KXS12735.1 hypothetical protein M427DRAFT_157122 [Gonapodya prolifera JEL478]
MKLYPRSRRRFSEQPLLPRLSKVMKRSVLVGLVLGWIGVAGCGAAKAFSPLEQEQEQVGVDLVQRLGCASKRSLEEGRETRMVRRAPPNNATSVCPSDLTLCATGCARLSTDIYHCGSCDTVCSSGVAQATDYCISGRCEFACDPGRSAVSCPDRFMCLGPNDGCPSTDTNGTSKVTAPPPLNSTRAAVNSPNGTVFALVLLRDPTRSLVCNPDGCNAPQLATPQTYFMNTCSDSACSASQIRFSSSPTLCLAASDDGDLEAEGCINDGTTPGAMDNLTQERRKRQIWKMEVDTLGYSGTAIYSTAFKGSDNSCVGQNLTAAPDHIDIGSCHKNTALWFTISPADKNFFANIMGPTPSPPADPMLASKADAGPTRPDTPIIAIASSAGAVVAVAGAALGYLYWARAKKRRNKDDDDDNFENTFDDMAGIVAKKTVSERRSVESSRTAHSRRSERSRRDSARMSRGIVSDTLSSPALSRTLQNLSHSPTNPRPLVTNLDTPTSTAPRTGFNSPRVSLSATPRLQSLIRSRGSQLGSGAVGSGAIQRPLRALSEAILSVPEDAAEGAPVVSGLDTVQLPRREVEEPDGGIVGNINPFYLALGGHPLSSEPVVVNRILVAISDFAATLTDELDMVEGSAYLVELLWADGWSYARNMTTGASGYVPIVGLTSGPDPDALPDVGGPRVMEVDVGGPRGMEQRLSTRRLTEGQSRTSRRGGSGEVRAEGEPVRLSSTARQSTAAVFPSGARDDGVDQVQPDEVPLSRSGSGSQRMMWESASRSSRRSCATHVAMESIHDREPRLSGPVESTQHRINSVDASSSKASGRVRRHDSSSSFTSRTAGSSSSSSGPGRSSPHHRTGSSAGMADQNTSNNTPSAIHDVMHIFTQLETESTSGSTRVARSGSDRILGEPRERGPSHRSSSVGPERRSGRSPRSEGEFSPNGGQGSRSGAGSQSRGSRLVRAGSNGSTFSMRSGTTNLDGVEVNLETLDQLLVGRHITREAYLVLRSRLANGSRMVAVPSV